MKINDDVVSVVSLEEALSQYAYILFYQRIPFQSSAADVLSKLQSTARRTSHLTSRSPHVKSLRPQSVPFRSKSYDVSRQSPRMDLSAISSSSRNFSRDLFDKSNHRIPYSQKVDTTSRDTDITSNGHEIVETLNLEERGSAASTIRSESELEGKAEETTTRKRRHSMDETSQKEVVSEEIFSSKRRKQKRKSSLSSLGSLFLDTMSSLSSAFIPIHNRPSDGSVAMEQQPSDIQQPEPATAPLTTATPLTKTAQTEATAVANPPQTTPLNGRSFLSLKSSGKRYELNVKSSLQPRSFTGSYSDQAASTSYIEAVDFRPVITNKSFDSKEVLVNHTDLKNKFQDISRSSNSRSLGDNKSTQDKYAPILFTSSSISPSSRPQIGNGLFQVNFYLP